jgi:integration host factor subunit beta
MTKHELSEEVAHHDPGFTPQQVATIVNALFASLTEALVKGERIELRGFGVFSVKPYAAREGRNPRTGATVAVAAKKVPRFKVSKELRRRVDGQEAAAPKPRARWRPAASYPSRFVAGC